MKKIIQKVLAAFAITGMFLVGGVALAAPANAITGSYVTNVGSTNIQVQQSYNGPVRVLGPGQGGTLMAQAVVIPIGQCYKIQRAPGYAYGEYCNIGTKSARYITVTDYQRWNVFRSR